jgi:hypothetical protein
MHFYNNFALNESGAHTSRIIGGGGVGEAGEKEMAALLHIVEEYKHRHKTVHCLDVGNVFWCGIWIHHSVVKCVPLMAQWLLARALLEASHNLQVDFFS